MLRTVFLALHTVTAVAAFAFGARSLTLESAASWPFRLYLGALLAMVVFLTGAVALDWPGLAGTTRFLFAGLVGLGLYILWRARRAHARLRRRHDDWRGGYVDDVGFTLIALFEGFVIVSAIDLGAPAWVVALIAVAGVIVGARIIRRIKLGLLR